MMLEKSNEIEIWQDCECLKITLYKSKLIYVRHETSTKISEWDIKPGSDAYNKLKKFFEEG